MAAHTHNPYDEGLPFFYGKELLLLAVLLIVLSPLILAKALRRRLRKKEASLPVGAKTDVRP
jgi:hypothetical protein